MVLALAEFVRNRIGSVKKGFLETRENPALSPKFPWSFTPGFPCSTPRYSLVPVSGQVLVGAEEEERR